MARSVILLILLAIVFQPVEAQWVSQNPSPYSGILNDVAFRNDREGWIVGEEGAILRTVDGGINWEIESWKPEISYYTIEFISQQVGFIGGHDGNTGGGILLITFDGGVNWSVDDSSFRGYYPRDLFFTDQETGWILGRNGVIFKTFDAGQTWDSIFHLESTPSSNFVKKIFFVDKQYGWAIQGGDFPGWEDGIYRTTDGGYTWEYYETENMNGMYFFDQDHGLAVGSVLTQGHYYGTIFKTTDGGQTWETEISGDQNIIYNDVVFKTPERGWLVGSHGMIKHTNNGGANWNEQYELPGNLYIAYHKLLRISVKPDGSLIAVGVPGLIAQTENDYNWEVNEPFTVGSLISLFLLDDQTGWAGDQHYNIYNYSAQAAKWDKIYSHQYDDANDLFFMNELTGWYSSGFGKIFHTDDGGHNWTLQTQAGSYWDDLVTMDFVSQDTGWAAGDNRKILYTSDGGLNWGYTGYQATFQIASIDFVNYHCGWAVGGQGGIIHTTNWGWGWDEQTSPTMANLYSVCFVNSKTGWVCGEFGKILHTGDGGETWVKQNSKTNEDLNSIIFVDKFNGWAAGNKGTIVHTTDGGVNWFREASTTDRDLYVIHAPDPMNCWTGGEQGTLLYADYYGWTGLEDKVLEPGMSFNVFPNPFIGFIEVDIHPGATSPVHLSLVDINGKVVSQQIFKLTSGSGPIIQTENLSPGIYLLRLENSEINEVRKVVRIKK